MPCQRAAPRAAPNAARVPAHRHHLQPLSRTVSANRSGKASKPRCACASRHGGRALCAIPLANADGSARALGARFNCGSPRARAIPCAAASAPRQRKSRAGAVDGACPAPLDGVARAAGVRGVIFVNGADGDAGAGCGTVIGCITGGGCFTGAGFVTGAGGNADAGCRDAGAIWGDAGREDSAGNKSTKKSAACRGGASVGPSSATRHSHHAANACKAQATPTAHQATPRERSANGADRDVPITKKNITAVRTIASVKKCLSCRRQAASSAQSREDL